MTPADDRPIGAPVAHRPAAWRRIEQYVRSRLVWGWTFRTLSYLRSALWVIPIIAIALVMVLSPALRALDAWLGWRVSGLGVAGATALFQTVITLTLSFLVFTFGSLLVAIQVAGGQLTPRIIATTLLRDNVVRYSVGLFVFALVYAIYALNRIGTTVPELVALIGALLGIASMAMFMFLIDYAARLLRPVSILARVGNLGLAVIESVYPHAVSGAHDEKPPRSALPPLQREVRHRGASQIVLAIDLEMLLEHARRNGGVIEIAPQIGDFVARDEPLFRLYGGAGAVDDRPLRSAIAFGAERTIEQDPMFAFRILVDIALKALSPAINDPTTAVLAIDQVHRLLRAAGRRRLHAEELLDDAGRLRVIHRTPDWDDFVLVACSEIRQCGAAQLQIARRLRALLDNLLAALPAHRHPALLREKARLDSMIETAYPLPDERALARIPDVQGLGGSSAARAAQ